VVTTKGISAKKLVRLFRDNIWRLYGLSVRVVNDRLGFIYFLSLLFLFSVYFIFSFSFSFFILNLGKGCDVMLHVMVTQVTKHNESMTPIIE